MTRFSVHLHQKLHVRAWVKPHKTKKKAKKKRIVYLCAASIEYEDVLRVFVLVHVALRANKKLRKQQRDVSQTKKNENLGSF